MSSPIDILGCGMVTGVGFNAPATCAAIRVGITGFVETRFMFDADWLIGCPVPFKEGWRGRERMLQMLLPAIEEALGADRTVRTENTALLLCLAEEARPGRVDGLDQSMLEEIQARLGRKFHAESKVFASGRVGGVDALKHARELWPKRVSNCLIAGVDSHLIGETLTWLHERRRILTAENSDGFIPGESAAAVLIAASRDSTPGRLRLLGLGLGVEPAPVDGEKPFRADGMVQAIRAALSDAGITFADLDYRIADVSGDQYSFKESALSLGRAIRPVKADFDFWHPADCLGELGAAAVPIVLGVAHAAASKRYAPGKAALCHFATDDGRRAALALRGDFEARSAS